MHSTPVRQGTDRLCFGRSFDRERHTSSRVRRDFMIKRIRHCTWSGVALLAVSSLAAVHANGQTLQEYSAETRFQLDLHVSDAALAALLPQGWKPNVADRGPAKDANLRVIFIDRLTINGPDGKPLGKGSNQLVYLAAPVKDPSGANVQLIVGGLTADPADAPGPFGNYILASSHNVQRSTVSASAGPTLESQDWSFTAATGEHIEMRIKFERGVANKGN